LKSDYTFLATDAGTATFTARLLTAGTQALTATDTVGFFGGTQNGILVTPAAAVSFAISAPPTATQGVPFRIQVFALDPYGNIDTNYTGTVAFTSSDDAAALPDNYMFQPGDAGVATFTVTLNTLDDQTIMVTDIMDNSINGTTVVTVACYLPVRGQRMGRSDMANRLKMALIEAILSLRARGWSRRRIARELGIDRDPLRQHKECGLEGVLCVRLVSQHGAADIQHHRAVASQQGGERRVVAPRAEPAQQLLVGQALEALVLDHAANHVQDRAGSGLGHQAPRGANCLCL
jgi:hypothetical protein